MKKTVFNFSALAALFVPAMAFAQNFTYVDSWVTHGLIYLRLAITVITILMTLYFMLSVLRFIMNKDPAKAGDFRKTMINGLIGLFVSVAVWGIIGLASNITGVNTGSQAQQQSIACPPGLQYHQDTGTCGTLLNQ